MTVAVLTQGGRKTQLLVLLSVFGRGSTFGSGPFGTKRLYNLTENDSSKATKSTAPKRNRLNTFSLSAIDQKSSPSTSHCYGYGNGTLFRLGAGPQSSDRRKRGVRIMVWRLPTASAQLGRTNARPKPKQRA